MQGRPLCGLGLALHGPASLAIVSAVHWWLRHNFSKAEMHPTSLPTMKAVLPWKGWVCTGFASSVISSPRMAHPAEQLSDLLHTASQRLCRVHAPCSSLRYWQHCSSFSKCLMFTWR